jgi:uncharacterized protein YkwD
VPKRPVKLDEIHCVMRTSLELSMCLAILLSSHAHADAPTRVEIERVEQCAGKTPAVVEVSDPLNEVARALSRGRKLEAATERLGYAAASVSSVYIKGWIGDHAISEIIEDRYCTASGERPFTEFGFYERRNEVWIVLAAPFEEPVLDDAATVDARVLELVNAARKQPRRCGDSEMAAVPPLSLSRTLSEAALRHARDMAEHSMFRHRGSDGSQPADRVSAAGYRWRAVGENIAAGQSSAEEVVESWLDSPGHCVNIMGGQFQEMGVAFELAPKGKPSIYWAQEFASPR